MFAFRSIMCQENGVNVNIPCSVNQAASFFLFHSGSADASTEPTHDTLGQRGGGFTPRRSLQT